MNHQIQMFTKPIPKNFINTNVEKIFSSSTKPMIWTIVNFAPFMNSLR